LVWLVATRPDAAAHTATPYDSVLCNTTTEDCPNVKI